ncbi:FeoA family protein [Desulfurobacterium thermolithotrophum DSM 11699]|uniref:FeoA family protein n=1 Tax=Desulfurobacterium thermolithotrophum (strain DSM 11699 / BSA) TaxID=868864 RepID=F0S1H1_DESTD|nr:FeoA family protein [Desulfurobacterium thermolithotrophum]ADY73974.1 FeoA family protein [Desulfurobacterium thermolithotrophum DSM 11699]
MRLVDIPSGKSVKIIDITGGMGMRNRLAAIGIYPGATIKVVKAPPGPMIIEAAGTRLALGKGMASRIEVEEE